jgi:D-amino peptidase
VHVAEVKRSFGRYSAESMSPSESRKTIRQAAEECLQGLPKPPPVQRPVTLELTFLVADMASMSEWIRGVERSGPRTVSFTAADGLEAYQTFHALVTLTRSLVE